MSSKSIDFIKDINDKYHSIEFELDKKLNLIQNQMDNFKINDVEKMGNNESSKKTFCPSLEAARQRNQQLIEDLERSKARLRSQFIYSPTEETLRKAQNNYLDSLALEPNTIPFKKKYGPVFV